MEELDFKLEPKDCEGKICLQERKKHFTPATGTANARGRFGECKQTSLIS